MTGTQREQLMAIIDASLAQARAEGLAQSWGESCAGVSPLPAGTPLFADVKTAAGLFDMSPRLLTNLRLSHRDFPAGKLGENSSKVLYDIPRCYAWFARRLGTDAKE